MTFSDYKQYKWFFTSNEKLVVGGKSAIQNDSLLKRIKDSKQEFIVMHTSEPGSPFTIIIADPNKVTPSDIEETAIFTGSFSRAWRSAKKEAKVDIFKASQLSKPTAKAGTWHVQGTIQHSKVSLALVLTKQKDTLRAIPEKTVNAKDILLKITPGKTDKVKMLPQLKEALKDKFSEAEILSALPAGGLEISEVKEAKKQTKAKPKKKTPKTKKKTTKKRK